MFFAFKYYNIEDIHGSVTFSDTKNNTTQKNNVHSAWPNFMYIYF